MHANQIDKVILVGGATRTPMVHRLLQERLGQPIHAEVDPDLCVAMGAAIQGGLIAGVDVGPVLVDITPHTLGIQTFGGLHGYLSSNCFSRLIERNTSLPASRSEIYGTMVDGQEQARISVFQGEDDDVRHNDSVGEFVLEDLAEVERGNEILVRFDLDLDGILKVSATERTTGRQKQLIVDNAVTRFRARNREEAMARLAATFCSDRDSAPADRGQEESPGETASGTDPSDEMKRTIANGEQLIAKGEQIAPNANPEDAEEVRQLIETLRSARPAARGRHRRDHGETRRPRLLLAGRLMEVPMHDEDAQGGVRCPTCHAEQEWSDVCRRCKCDLRLLRSMAEACRRHRRRRSPPSAPAELTRPSGKPDEATPCAPTNDRRACWRSAIFFAGTGCERLR